MTFKSKPTSYNPNNLVSFGGNYTNPTTGKASWSPAFENPNVVFADLPLGGPTKVPSFADKLSDFNSKYGSTIMGGLQAAGGLWESFNGMQQNKLVKQQMANSLNQWNKNYDNQVASYNTRLEDRQNARVAAQGANQQDSASYMAKNRLK